MKKCMYIVEGEIEERFLQQLKQLGLVVPGKVFTFNLMQKQLKHTSNILAFKNYSAIYCVIDTDVVDKGNIENLVQNIKLLKTIGKPRILVQNKNFEDELMRILELPSIAALGKLLGSKQNDVRWVKRSLSQNIDYSKHINRDNIVKYCSRYHSFQKFLNNKKSGIDNLVCGYECLKKG